MPSKATKTNLVEIGRIVGAFGIQGELKCDPSNAGRTLFFVGATLQTDRESQIVIAAVREHKGRLLLRIKGIESATDAEACIGVTIYAPRENVEKTLEANEYLDEDLIGCAVYSIEKELLGNVDDVQHYPASDMLVVKGKMIPLVGAFIQKIDIEGKRIVVDLPAGLLD